MASAETALGRSFATDDGVTCFDVLSLTVREEPDRSVTLVFELSIRDRGNAAEHWEARQRLDKSATDLFLTPEPDRERLGLLVPMVRNLLVEWWDTKDSDRRSAKAGRRLS